MGAGGDSLAHPALSPWDGLAGDLEDVLRSMACPLQGWGDSQGKAPALPTPLQAAVSRPGLFVTGWWQQGHLSSPGDKVGLLR